MKKPANSRNARAFHQDKRCVIPQTSTGFWIWLRCLLVPRRFTGYFAKELRCCDVLIGATDTLDINAPLKYIPKLIGNWV